MENQEPNALVGTIPIESLFFCASEATHDRCVGHLFAVLKSRAKEEMVTAATVAEKLIEEHIDEISAAVAEKVFAQYIDEL